MGSLNGIYNFLNLFFLSFGILFPQNQWVVGKTLKSDKCEFESGLTLTSSGTLDRSFHLSESLFSPL